MSFTSVCQVCGVATRMNCGRCKVVYYCSPEHQNEIAALVEHVEIVQKQIRMRELLEAIRKEKVGREIHHRRFFLKMDRGHKIRLNLLERRMVGAAEALAALLNRVIETRKEYLDADGDSVVGLVEDLERQAKEMGAGRPPATANGDKRGDDILKTVLSKLPKEKMKKPKGSSKTNAPEEEEEGGADLIEIQIFASKKKSLDKLYKIFLQTREEYLAERLNDDERDDLDLIRSLNIVRDALQQYGRRIVLQDPVLFEKAQNKVSWEDLFLDIEFQTEDFQRLCAGFGRATDIGLLWLKDSVIEAIAMWPEPGNQGTSATAGEYGHRHKILGRWVYTSYNKKLTSSPETWWYIFDILGSVIERDTENRFMRLCNSFEDMQTLFSIAGFGLMPVPTTFEKYSIAKERNVLTQCGVVVADFVATAAGLGLFGLPAGSTGPFPSTNPASRRGYITWAEMESRSYMFGAVRNEPDVFTDAFISELRARPDLFIVITRSETDPGRVTDEYGAKGLEPFAQMRMRTFEAPHASFDERPRGRGAWDVTRSARDVLYGGDLFKANDFNAPSRSEAVRGYITELEGPNSSGWLFHFKNFEVKYFVILDAKANTDGKEMMREVEWAALRAAGLVQGKRTLSKRIKAMDSLMKKRTGELFAWLPPSVATTEYRPASSGQ
ncbi:hypothetical protein OF83DRAFT_1083404 [Amylostereum chailletii]|nr:hypothetical protein OF83DRAFT_1083404 [Amylostereum chailletii]